MDTSSFKGQDRSLNFKSARKVNFIEFLIFKKLSHVEFWCSTREDPQSEMAIQVLLPQPCYAVGGNINCCSSMENSTEVPQKLELLRDPTIPLLVAQPRLSLCDPTDCSPRGSSVRGISQARIGKWAAVSYSRDLPGPRIKPPSLVSPALAGRFFTTVPPGKPKYPDKITIQKDTGSPVLSAAVLTTARTRRQLKSPLPDERAKKWCE